jgi:hypothetical protein
MIPPCGWGMGFVELEILWKDYGLQIMGSFLVETTASVEMFLTFQYADQISFR